MKLPVALAALAGLIFLSGCMSAEAENSEDRAFCASIGATPGNGLMECMMGRIDQRETTRQRRSMALMNFGNNINQMNQRQAMINSMNRPVNTTCRQQGIYTNCTSY